jgi:hypothetical protein
MAEGGNLIVLVLLILLVISGLGFWFFGGENDED